MPVGHVAPGLALLGGAIAALIVALVVPKRRQSICAWVALAGIFAALLVSVRLHGDLAPQLTFSGAWALDGVTAWAGWLIMGATALVVLISPSWLHSDPRHGEWYTLLLMSALGALMLAGAADLMELMVGMLLVSVTGYALASYHRASRMSSEAGMKYFLLGALTNPLLFLGIVLLYGATGMTGYAEISQHLASAPPVELLLIAAVALIFLGLVFEIGAAPVHPWVPDVSQGSPVPAAAFLTVVPKMGALIGLTRFVSLLPEEALAWRLLVAIVAALTMSIGNLAALWQDDVRRLLGWSSVSQAGYGLLAVVAVGRSELTIAALFLFLLGYGIANIAAFATVAALRGRTRRDDYAGLTRTRPWHAAALTLALLSLTGIPPLVGFFAKLLLFGAAIEAGFAWLAFVAVVNTVASLFYYLRVIGPMFVGTPGVKPALLRGLATGTAVVSAIGTVAAGLLAELIFGRASSLSFLP